MQFGADLAESFVPVEVLVGFSAAHPAPQFCFIS
jgi:hypothetical protein